MEKIKKTETKPVSKEKPKKRKGVIRENIESILIAVALALAMRFFVVEAFKIPTGSMAPTLLGAHKDIKCPNCTWRFYHNNGDSRAFCPNCLYKINTYNLGNRSGNRILVSKVFYKFTKPNPKRWDVLVFKYPRYDITCKSCSYKAGDVEWHDDMKCPMCGSERLRKKQKNYIKRLVGLPGETLQVINGNLYINNHIQRKPPKVQDALWVPAYNSNYPSRRKVFASWEGGNGQWKNEEKVVKFHAENDDTELSFVSLGKSITNYSGYNSLTSSPLVRIPTKYAGYNSRNDLETIDELMIRFDIQVAKGSGGIAVAIEEDGNKYMAFIRSKDSEQASYLERSGTILMSDSNSYIEPGKKHKIEFSNVDDMLTLLLDEKLVFSYDNAQSVPPARLKWARNHQSEVQLGCAGTSATFSNIEIFADVYYTNSPRNWGVYEPVKLGEEEYFFLGDNSSSSNDSRYWKFVPEKNLVGRAFLTFWPPKTLKLIR